MKKIALPILYTLYAILYTLYAILHTGRAFAQDIPYTEFNDAIGLGSNGAIKTDSLGGIVGGLLPYILTFAGLILFAMLVMGAFTMLAGAADKESQEKGKKQITSAFVGFFIIFAAYWIAQILQVIFKVNILS